MDGTYEDAVARAAAAGEEEGTLEIADVGTSGPARWVVDGYATLFAEIADEGAFDLVIVPVGVGSLAAAAARFGAAGARACRRRRAAERGVPHGVVGARRADRGADAGHHDGRPRLRGGVGVRVADAARRPQRHRDRRRRRGERRDERARGRGLRIGESGAAPLAGLRALASDPDAAPLREAVALGRGDPGVLIATEGPTGLDSQA